VVSVPDDDEYVWIVPMDSELVVPAAPRAARPPRVRTAHELELMVAPVVVAGASLMSAGELRGGETPVIFVQYEFPSGNLMTAYWQRLSEPLRLETVVVEASQDCRVRWPSGSEAVLVDHSSAYKQVMFVRPSGSMLNVILTAKRPSVLFEHSVRSLAVLLRDEVDSQAVDR
jgi:hypothetical protein